MEVEFYETPNKRCPAIDYLDSLDNKMKAKTLRTIDLLERNGYMLRMPYSESLNNELFVLRSKHGSNITRLFYFYSNNKIIITNGFSKKTNKIPKKEIDLAISYKNEYERKHKK